MKIKNIKNFVKTGKRRKYIFSIIVSMIVFTSVLFGTNFFKGFLKKEEFKIIIEDSPKLKKENINGTHQINFNGKGLITLPGGENTLLDTNVLNYELFPKLNYYNTTIEIYPKYVYKEETLANNISVVNSKNIVLDNKTYDYISNIELNLSSIEYLTRFDNTQNIVAASAKKIMGDNIDNDPDYEGPTVNLNGFKDNNLTTYGVWIEAIGIIDIAEIEIEVAIEITNSDMDGVNRLKYEEYWFYLRNIYNLTLESIKNAQNSDIIIGNECWWEASIMYRSSDGINHAINFDNVYRSEFINVSHILANYQGKNPDNWYSPSKKPLWNYDNRSINIPNNITEQMFTDYSYSQGYSGINGGNYNNPVITFNFRAKAVGKNTNINDLNRYGENWAKIKIMEFNTKHQFQSNLSQYNQLRQVNNINDVFIEYFNESEWINYSINKSTHNIFNSWALRKKISEKYNYFKISTDLYDSYEFIKVKIQSIESIFYKKVFNTSSDLTIDHILLERNQKYWKFYSKDLTLEPFFSMNISNSNFIFNLSTLNWELEPFIGYIYNYSININHINYKDEIKYRNSQGSLQFSENMFLTSNLIINWKNITFKGNYVKNLYMNSEIQLLEYELIDLSENQGPKWFSISNFTETWKEGMPTNILLNWTLDSQTPRILKYQVINTLNDENVKEFNISGTDDGKLFYSEICFKNYETLIVKNFTLMNKQINNSTFFVGMNINNLNVGIYYVWYKLYDRAGNYNITTPFLLNVSGNSILPHPFSLTSDAGNPDLDGKFSIFWESSINAINYSIFQLNKSNNKLFLIDDGVFTNEYSFQNYNNGTHTFIVNAFNQYGNSSSNYIKINIKMGAVKNPNFIFYILTITITISIVSVVSVFFLLNRKFNFINFKKTKSKTLSNIYEYNLNKKEDVKNNLKVSNENDLWIDLEDEKNND